MVRRPSSLRESRSACDLMDNEEEETAHSGVDGSREGEGEGEVRHSRSATSPAFSSGRYRPEASPTSSESSDDACDFQDHFPSPPSSSSSSSLSLHEDRLNHTHARPTRETTSTTKPPCLSLAQRRPRPLAPLSSLSPADHHSSRESTAPSPGLPKAQPLARTLFARMADTPHAGTGLGLGGRKGGGKQKMIVATKPMRTTFELGLTSSELARRA